MEYYVQPKPGPGQGPHSPHRKVINANRPDLAKAEYVRKYGKKAKVTDPNDLEVRYASNGADHKEGDLVSSKAAPTRVTSHDDSQFIRTALVIGAPYKESGSIDVVTADGVRLAQINLFVIRDSRDLGGKGSLQFMADVIDVDGLFGERVAIVFPGKKVKRQKIVKAGNLVGADFKRRVK